MSRATNTPEAGRKSGLSAMKKLSRILPLMVGGLSLASCITVGVLGYVNGREGLTKAAESELRILANARKSGLEIKLATVKSDLANLVSSANTTIVLNEMNEALKTLDQDRAALDGYYRASGEISERAKLTGDGNKTMYSWRHTSVHGTYMATWQQAGYGDIYVLNLDGQIVYSVTKSADFLEKVDGSKLNGSGIARAFHAAKGLDDGTQALVDFDRYTGAGDHTSAFIAQPVFLSDFVETKRAGVMIVRVDVGFVDNIIGSRESLGETGQAYLIGEDGKLRSNLPLSDEPTALEVSIDSALLRNAAGGSEGFGAVERANGEMDFAAAVPFPFKIGRAHV